MALCKSEKLKYYEQSERTFYEDGERVSNDIDILVSQADLNNIQILLNELGFKQSYYDLRQKKQLSFPGKKF